MKIKITSDSTCDLGELIEKNDIGIMGLKVILGTETYKDCFDINPQMIFDYVEQTGELPKTAAPSIVEYEEFFAPYVEEGYEVIHFSISQKSSSSHNYAKAGAESFNGKVTVVDTKALSSGSGLMVLHAVELKNKGCSVSEIVDSCNELANRINTSFIPDRLDYLHKGGRCSKMAMFSANILKVHPLIEMNDGQLVPSKKYTGTMKRCIKNYIDDLKLRYPNYDKKRCFVTHSSADRDIVDFAIAQVKEFFEFEEVIETVANSVITGHCGKNTLGVLFVYEN